VLGFGYSAADFTSFYAKRQAEYKTRRTFMGQPKLTDIYKESGVARAFLDHMADRQRNQSETKVGRTLQLLSNDGYEFSRGDIVGLFKRLEEAQVGQFVAGRRGWPSRFVWSVGSLSASRLAAGEHQDIEQVTTESESDETGENGLTVHLFNLRSDLVVELPLPTDLTSGEAERLALFVSSLPLEEFE
jgi:hypothetical protein